MTITMKLSSNDLNYFDKWQLSDQLAVYRAHCEHTPSPWLFVGDSFVRRCKGLLFDAAGGNRTLKTRTKCSSGMLTVLLALERCNSTSVFGGVDVPCAAYSYYRVTKPAHSASCSQGSTTNSANRDHLFGLEHDIYATWSWNGKLAHLV